MVGLANSFETAGPYQVLMMCAGGNRQKLRAMQVASVIAIVSKGKAWTAGTVVVHCACRTHGTISPTLDDLLDCLTD